MSKNIFQKIIDGEVPADFTYKDEHIVAFLDVFPKSRGHMLVVPIKQYRWIQDMPKDEYTYLMGKVQDFINPLKDAVSSDYVHMAIVGEEIPHVHVHMMPRKLGDSLGKFQYADGEKQSLAEKISDFINNEK